MKNLRLLLLSGALLLICAFAKAKTYGVDDIPNIQRQDSTRLLINPDGIVSPAAAARIDSLLVDARRLTTAEIAAVIVDDIDSDDITDFATRLFNKWRIGKSDKNNGILLIVAKDSRQLTIRTGYGTEGVMPDIIAGRIGYDVMSPYFREGDYSGGMLAGVEKIHAVVTDPDVREELRSQYSRTASSDGISADGIFTVFLYIGVAVNVIFLIVLIVVLVQARGKSDYEKYNLTSKLVMPFIICSIFFLFIPAPVYLLLWALRRHWRDKPRICPNCRTKMGRVDEEHDNYYLTAPQDLEEKLNSVDYDVWLCPNCGETDIYSYVNHASSYRECPQCKARTLRLVGTRTLVQPTTTREGVGEKIYECLNCHNRKNERYTIPKKTPAPVVVAGSGGFRGGGGGGFGGGGFGGGLTGGGGATVRW